MFVYLIWFSWESGSICQDFRWFRALIIAAKAHFHISIQIILPIFDIFILHLPSQIISLLAVTFNSIFAGEVTESIIVIIVLYWKTAKN